MTNTMFAHYALLFLVVSVVTFLVGTVVVLGVAEWCKRGDDADGPINLTDKEILTNVY